MYVYIVQTMTDYIKKTLFRQMKNSILTAINFIVEVLSNDVFYDSLKLSPFVYKMHNIMIYLVWTNLNVLQLDCKYEKNIKFLCLYGFVYYNCYCYYSICNTQDMNGSRDYNINTKLILCWCLNGYK